MFSKTHPSICSLQTDPVWVWDPLFPERCFLDVASSCKRKINEWASNQTSATQQSIRPAAWFLRDAAIISSSILSFFMKMLNCSPIVKAVTPPERRSFPEASDTERPWWILASHQGRKSEFHGRRGRGHYRHIHCSSYSNGNQLVTKMHLAHGVMSVFNGFPPSAGSEWTSARRRPVIRGLYSVEPKSDHAVTRPQKEARIHHQVELNRSHMFEVRGRRSTRAVVLVSCFPL